MKALTSGHNSEQVTRYSPQVNIQTGVNTVGRIGTTPLTATLKES